MANQEYRFETKQVHVGQEQPDPTTDARAVPIYATPLMCSRILHRQQAVLV